MADSQGNPFIGNPFMQKGNKTPPVERESKSQPRQTPAADSPLSPSEKNSELPANPSKKSARSSKSSKALSKSPTAKTRSSSKRKRASQPEIAPPAYTGDGYKVQVLAKIPMPSNTNMPSRDYLWFAVYPIIPRVGDCLFHDGRYFRVDAVFLYENTNVGWCADLEVSYYTRRH
ncbi:MAG: hypothetical protein AAGI69_06025 [Cyanobacteria bacterium P01_H01_bin.21]